MGSAPSDLVGVRLIDVDISDGRWDKAAHLA